MNPPESLVCRLLRGERVPGSLIPAAGEAGPFIDAARLHSVLPLLHERLAADPDKQAWPAEILTACHDAAIGEAVADVLRHEELLRVLEGFAKAGVKPLLLKGAALAHTHYPMASLRPRVDTDMLVRKQDQAAACEALSGMGYAHNHGISGEYIAYQSSWTHRDRHGAAHHMDLHWRINNSQVLAGALDYEELEKRAVPIPALGPHAFALAPIHALLLACMHRAGHMGNKHHSDEPGHPGGDVLIWLYDMHLLVSGMSPTELEEFAKLATEKRMKAVCRDALECTAIRFATPIPAWILDSLENPGTKESSESLLGGQPAVRMLGDFAAIPGLAGRARWLRELAFPSPGYMRQKYPDAAFDWLPWLYAKRAASGLWRLAFPRHRDPLR